MAEYLLLKMANTVDKVINQKVGKITLLDGALIGASKMASEELLARLPMVGNGTARSGLIKVGAALAVSMGLGNKKAFQIISTGMLLDGMEDLVLYARKTFTWSV